MSIQYLLRENKLTPDPGEFSAQVCPVGTADLDALVDHMIKLEGSTAVRANVLSTLEDFFSAVEDLLLLGYNVRTPLANFRMAIKGVFEGPRDGYDPSRHQVLARIQAGKRLRQSVDGKAQPIKTAGRTPKPKPEEYLDHGSGAVNGALTPTGVGELLGKLLRFDPADPAQGIFFLDAGGGEVRAEEVIRNRPGEMIFVVPALPPGDYQLQVRAIVNGNSQVREGTLEKTLTVA